MKRALTENEEQAYRLCHHDFESLGTAEAASKMGVTQHEVQRLLSSVKKKAPQLFPILTQTQKQVHDLWLEMKPTHEIAEELNTSISNIENIVNTINKKFGFTKLKIERVLSFNDRIEGRIKQKF